MTLNTRIFYDINDFARAVPWLQPIVAAYAAYGIVLFAALLVAGWWIARKHADPRRVAAALWAPLGMLAAVAINQPVATAFAVTRPCQELRDIVVLHCNTDSGFPSDHAVMAGAVVAGDPCRLKGFRQLLNLGGRLSLGRAGQHRQRQDDRCP